MERNAASGSPTRKQSSGRKSSAARTILIGEKNAKSTALKNIHLEVPITGGGGASSPENQQPRPKSNLSNATSSSTTSSSMLDPKATNNSGVASVSVSPRSKPRLSFDEISIQKQEEWRRQSTERKDGIATVCDQVPPHAVSVSELRKGSSIRRSSNVSVPGSTNHVHATEPSIHSGQSNPSLQDDMCSEIVRLDNDTRNNSLSLSGKNQHLRRFVHVFQVLNFLLRNESVS